MTLEMFDSVQKTSHNIMLHHEQWVADGDSALKTQVSDFAGSAIFSGSKFLLRFPVTPRIESRYFEKRHTIWHHVP